MTDTLVGRWYGDFGQTIWWKDALLFVKVVTLASVIVGALEISRESWRGYLEQLWEIAKVMRKY